MVELTTDQVLRLTRLPSGVVADSGSLFVSQHTVSSRNESSQEISQGADRDAVPASTDTCNPGTSHGGSTASGHQRSLGPQHTASKLLGAAADGRQVEEQAGEQADQDPKGQVSASNTAPSSKRKKNKKKQKQTGNGTNKRKASSKNHNGGMVESVSDANRATTSNASQGITATAASATGDAEPQSTQPRIPRRSKAEDKNATSPSPQHEPVSPGVMTTTDQILQLTARRQDSSVFATQEPRQQAQFPTQKHLHPPLQRHAAQPLQRPSSAKLRSDSKQEQKSKSTSTSKSKPKLKKNKKNKKDVESERDHSEQHDGTKARVAPHTGLESRQSLGTAESQGAAMVAEAAPGAVRVLGIDGTAGQTADDEDDGFYVTSGRDSNGDNLAGAGTNVSTGPRTMAAREDTAGVGASTGDPDRPQGLPLVARVEQAASTHGGNGTVNLSENIHIRMAMADCIGVPQVESREEEASVDSSERDDADGEQISESAKTKIRILCMMVGCVVLTTIVIIVVAIVVMLVTSYPPESSADDDGSLRVIQTSSPTTMSPSASPTELNLMLSLMLLLSPNAYSDSKDISSTTDNIATPGTPQQLVFEWLCPDETCGFPEDEAERIEARLSDAGRVMELQQLYALATFYLSTGASEWLQRDGWEDDLSTLVDDSATMDPSITSSPLTTLVFRSKGDTPAGGAAWCSWHGVECWQIPPSADLPVAVSYVSGLVLSQNDMHGVQIPSELAFLSTIQTFNISQNSLAGTLPSSLGENYAAHLEFFDVSYNILTGMVPSSYGVWEKVKLLDASHNLMSDKPPANVCELKVQLDTTIAMDCNKNDAGKVRVCCGCCRICCVGGRAETTDDGINFVENQCIEQSTGPLPNDCVLVDDG